MPRLKAQLHVHTKQDPLDFISHSEKEIIDYAANLGYEVLAISCHNIVIHTDYLKKYAEKKRILLIPAIEKDIEGKHVLIINADISAQNVNTFEQLKKYKENNPDCLIIAPHPFYPGSTSLGKKLLKNHTLFDAIEYSYFHSKHIDLFNKKAVKTAEKFKLPLLGTSDNHIKKYFDTTYSIITAEKNTKSVIKAIKAKKIEITSHPIPLIKLIFIYLNIAFRSGLKYFLLK